MPISSPISMYDHLLESSHRDDYNMWSNLVFGEKTTQIQLIEVNVTPRPLSGALATELSALHVMLACIN